MRRQLFAPAHDAFRAEFRRFAELSVAPKVPAWSRAGQCDRDTWRLFGSRGFLGLSAPLAEGGAGLDFLYDVIVIEELARIRAHGLMTWLHANVGLPYLFSYGSPDQRRRHVVDALAGRTILAVALTEARAGSDLGSLETTATRDRESYVLDGQKMFVSNGLIADLFIVAARIVENGKKAGAISLFLVEGDRPGLDRRPLAKLGLHGQATSELRFSGCRISVSNRLGRAGHGLRMIVERLQQERICLAVASIASCRRALEDATCAFRAQVGAVRAERPACDAPLALVEIATSVELGEAFLDQILAWHLRGRVDVAAVAMLKWWTASLHRRVSQECHRLAGMPGILASEPTALDLMDGVVQPIHGGTNEVMKVIIARSLGL